MGKVTFDIVAFYWTLDSQRRERKKDWSQVAKESGVSASTLSRMIRGHKPDIDNLAALLVWSGIEAAAFIRGAEKQEEAETGAMVMICSYLHSDPNLDEEGAKALEVIIRAMYRHLRKPENRAVGLHHIAYTVEATREIESMLEKNIPESADGARNT